LAAIVIEVVATPVVERLDAKTRIEHVVLTSATGTVKVAAASVLLVIVPQPPVVRPVGK
jgi:hypothetical protein